MLRGITNLYVPSVSHMTAQGGRMSFPVDSSSFIYSQFKYVAGTPAPEGTSGVAISKLNLLDVLIGRLNQMGNTSMSSAVKMDNDLSGSLVRDIDALIESLRKRLEDAQTSNEAMPYLPSPNIGPGTIFNLIA